MPAFPPSSAGTTSSILLVEDYGALAVAIGSALRRFAPGRNVAVVRSLGEAERVLLDEPTVELLVVDFDPAPGGGVAFFERIKDARPETKVLVIAAGSAKEVLRKRHQPCGLQFIEKPFELAELGAFIEGLLGIAAPPSFAGAIGSLANLNVADMIPLHALTDATAVLKVSGEIEREGELHFSRGRLVHAVVGEDSGRAALQEMLGWESPRFAVLERRPDGPRTFTGEWREVLARGLRALPRPAKKLSSRTTVKESRRRPASAPAGKKIVVVDDTEMLRIFVEEILATDDPTLQITVAGSGAEGLEAALQQLPDLLLLDYSLPDFNGDELCRRLLKDPKTARVPVLMMSGHVPEMSAAAGRYENIVGTLAKPFISSALVELVRSTLSAPPQFKPRSETEPAPTKAPAPPEVAPLPSPAPAAATPIVNPAPLVPPPPSEQPAPKEEHGGNGRARRPPDAPPAAESAASEPPIRSTATVAAPAMLPVPRATMPLGRTAAPLAPPQLLTPARIASASTSAVVVSVPLEVVSLQFSPTLRIAAIRARPASRTVSLHLDSQALADIALPEAGFELARVDLDARGQIQTMRLTPSAQRLPQLAPRALVPIEDVAVLRSNGDSAIQLMPGALTPMKMQLLASFDLAGVELTTSFGVASLVLRSRGGKMRVTLQPEAANTGALFDTAQVLLDRSARIAEILFDAVA